jgi:hypothetical protein
MSAALVLYPSRVMAEPMFLGFAITGLKAFEVS